MYPALAVYQRLPETDQVLWIGTQKGLETQLVPRAGIAYAGIRAGGLHGVGLTRMARNAWETWRGYLQARRHLRAFRPQVVFTTGGYVAGPVGLAAWKRVPLALYVPDIEPGMALKTLSRLATHIFLTVEESRAFFPHASTQVVGYPVRKEILAWDRDRGRQALNLPEDAPVLLVFGGSLGARSINLALLEALPRLLPRMYVVHISGRRDWPMVEERIQDLPPDLRERYRAFPYLHETMGAALAAADLAVARAGASTLGELPAHGLPAVLVPYPYAWRYQQVNARYLAERGAAIILPDERLPQDLAPLVLDLMADPARRQAMARAMRGLFRPQAAEHIAEGLRQLAGEGATHG